jgi:hypothetical protein
MLIAWRAGDETVKTLESDERLPPVRRELDALGDVLERIAPYQLVPGLVEMQRVAQVSGVL